MVEENLRGLSDIERVFDKLVESRVTWNIYFLLSL